MKWISVKDRLPDVEMEVLVFDGYDIGTGYLKENYEWFLFSENLYIKITHWMPLPEPPKKES